MTKTQLLQKLAEDSGLSRPEVKKLLETLTATAISELKSEGKFVIPDLLNLKLVTKAATPERDGVNPFTKAKMKIAAKPESKKVKATPVPAFKKAFDA
jgi:DNA-binding protein HU-beta